MASRSLYFLMRFHEVEELAWEAAERHHLYIVLIRPGRKTEKKKMISEYAAESGTISMTDGMIPMRIWFCPKMIDLKEVDLGKPSSYNPAKLGWVRCEVPVEKENILYISWIDARSDWPDFIEGCSYENPEALDTFKKVSSIFRKELKRPLYFSISGRVVRNVGYSRGAEEWVREGGLLKQGPKDKSLFLIDPPKGSST